MENPANSIVDSLGFREGLVAALVCCQESIRDVRVIQCPLWKFSHTNDPEPSRY